MISGSPRLADVTEESLRVAMAACRSVRLRRQALFKLSRVLAARGIIGAPVTGWEAKRGPRAETLASAPARWLSWAQRWRQFSTNQPGTVASMFTAILIAGRWAAEHHPDAVEPQHWTREIAAQYVADTIGARVGQWASHPHAKVRLGQPLTVAGRANRIDGLRGFFGDLIECEWIDARFDPRRVLILPPALRAQLGPDPRIIDDAAWAKLMAAGLTLNTEDLIPDHEPARGAAGRRAIRHPIEMNRALVGVWLFAGCRIDEIRRLELDCVIWDKGRDEQTGQTYPVCLLRVPQNKTSRAFHKPVDPVVGQLIEAWKLVRPRQPDLLDPKTGRVRQHLFCHHGRLVGHAYLNERLIPALCRKARHERRLHPPDRPHRQPHHRSAAHRTERRWLTSFARPPAATKPWTPPDRIYAPSARR